MSTRSDAARKGWATRRLRAEQAVNRAAAIAAQHRAEAAAAWARMGPNGRATAVERGFGAHLPAEHLATIIGDAEE